MQILGTHLGSSNDWGMVQTEIVSTFLPPRVKERFLASFVLNRFQGMGEDLTDYLTSVVEAAKILGFAGSESQLVGPMVQNMHPSVKSHLFFETRPESVSDLFQFATTITEAVAVEDLRTRANIPVLREKAPQPAVACLVGPARAQPRSGVRSWTCGGVGHFRSRCPGRTPVSNLGQSGNATCARP
jgi:hypothetical protein